MADSNVAVLLALLWNPPDAAAHENANRAHQRARELVAMLGESPTDDVVEEVERAAARIAAADYLPGDSPDDKWDESVAATEVHHPFAPESDAIAARRFLASKSEVEEVLAACQDAVQETPDAHRLAIAIWRHLPDEIAARAEASDQSAAWRSAAPVAHPAYPDSAWAVGSIRAATVAAGPEAALLIFTLASVQEYVGEVRRTQDLWMGSYLYAYFIWHAMRPIVEQYGPWSILTPDLRGHPFADLWLEHKAKLTIKRDPEQFSRLLPVASLPNVFTALVPKSDAAAMAEAARTRMLEARNRIACAVHDRFKQAVNAACFTSDNWEPLWEEQIKEFLVHDIYWAAVPWETPQQDVDRLQTFGGKDACPNAWIEWNNAATAPEQSVISAPGAGFPLAGLLSAQLLAARKNLRDFGPAPATAAGPLCTLCGARSAIRPVAGDLRTIRNAWETLAGSEKPKLQGRLRRNEQLCAVCLTKRLAHDAYFNDETPQRTFRAREDPAEENLAINRHQFPSTATVATLPFRRQLVKQMEAAATNIDGSDEARELFTATSEWLATLDKALSPKFRVPANLPPGFPRIPETVRSAAKRLTNVATSLDNLDQLDGSWFYASTYDPESLKRELGIPLSPDNNDLGEAARQLARVQQALRAWMRVNKATEPYRPPARYYAVVSLDGDHIGHWLQGRHNPEFRDLLTEPARAAAHSYLQRPPGPLSQAAMTAAGRAFAFDVAPSTVLNRDGSLIFAGGDDTLALVPREKALKLIQDLERRYRAYATKRGEVLLGPRASLSAAVIVAHHGAPLAEVMREAMATLKHVAKAEYGRNAFAVRVLKRSGPAIVAGLPWRVIFNDREHHPAGDLEAARDAFAGALARSLLADLRRAARALGGTDPEWLEEGDHHFIRGELLRFAGRHSPDEQAAQRAQAPLGRLYDAARASLQNRDGPNGPYTYRPPAKPTDPRLTPWSIVLDLAQVAEFLAREDEE